MLDKLHMQREKKKSSQKTIFTAYTEKQNQNKM